MNPGPVEVGDTGIEPVSPSVSRKRSPTELIAPTAMAALVEHRCVNVGVSPGRTLAPGCPRHPCVERLDTFLSGARVHRSGVASSDDS